MANNFNIIDRRKIDIGSIPNEFVLAQNKLSRKNRPLIFHILYALAASLCIYISLDSVSFGLVLLPIICTCLGPAMLVYTYIYSPVWIKLSALVLPIAADVIKYITSGAKIGFAHISAHLTAYILCILVSFVLMKTALSGYKKSTCFLLTTTSYVFITLLYGATLLIFYKGTINPLAAVKALDNTFANITESVIKEMSKTTFLSELRLVMPEIKNYSDDELISLLRETMHQSFSTIKLILPAIVTVSCMFFSMLTVAFFSVTARIMKIDVLVCIMDDRWTYRPSHVTTVFYDIVFFAYIIGMFLQLPQNISVTIINLLFILSPVMCVLGIKSLYNFIYKKTQLSAVSIIICAVIVMATLTFTGILGILILGSVGVSFINARDKEESDLLFIRAAELNEKIKSLFPEKISSQNTFDENTQSENGDSNNNNQDSNR